MLADIYNQLREIQTKCLQLAREITDMGLVCRLAATDFLIVAVDGTEMATELQKQNQLSVETIYSENKVTNLLRCQITLTETDDQLVETFRHVANEKFRISKDKRSSDKIRKKPKAVHMN